MAMALPSARHLRHPLRRALSSASATPVRRRPEHELERATKRALLLGSLPSEAKVVVCGGGAQGAAIAYTLAKRGLADRTVIIDKGEFGSGSTQHSSGLVPLLKPSPVETKLSKVSKALYLELEEKGFYTGWKEVGSLYVAQTLDRMIHYRRMKSNAVGRQVDCELLNVDQIAKRCPYINTDDLKGGLWVPGDGVADPREICMALTHLSRDMGVHVVPQCEVKQVVVGKDGAVKGVETDKGFIKCEMFVNSAGLWARHVATLSRPRVQLPVHAAEHYIIHCRPSAQDMASSMPVVRDPDGRIYVRGGRGASWDSRLLCGGFEKDSRPAMEETKEDSGDRRPEVSPPDWDHAYMQLENLVKRFPCLMEASFENLTNDPEPYSPDAEWILGHAPEIRNYFVAAAMRSSGVGAAGGVGEVLADFILQGRTSFDMYNLDVQRFLPLHNNRKFLRDRVKEVPGTLMSIPYPFSEFKTGRALRTSPIFTKLRDSGARFNQVMGYERTMYVKPTEPQDMLNSPGGIEAMLRREEDPSSLSVSQPTTFFKPPWFRYVEEEFTASRETCSLSDFTSFAKMMVWSNQKEDVVDFLEWMCSNGVDVPVGSVTFSGMQNERGGYENDCTVARTEDNRYLLMSPSIQQMRSFFWLKSHLPADKSVYLEDVTSLYTCLCLMGPHSKAVMARVAPDEQRTLETMKPFTVTYLDIGNVPKVLTINVTPTGELGYIMYIPNECANAVYDSIMAEGVNFGIRHCGYYAVRALRIEKFFAFWGQDLDSQSTPLECGRHFRTKTNTSEKDFIGKRALLEQLKPPSESGGSGVKKMLVMLLLDDYDHETDPWPWSGEPIFRDGAYVGSITTASYGFSLRRMVAIGFVHHFAEELDEEGERVRLPVTKEWVKEGRYEVEIAGQRFPVEVKLNSPAIPKTVSPTRHE